MTSSRQASLLNVDLIFDSGLSIHAPADRFRQAVIQAATFRGFTRGRVGVRFTDDAAIRELNRRHLGHDFETDVLSFGYDLNAPVAEGELVVSVETAERCANQLGWPVSSELLLYVVHGTLHVTGMDDADADGRAEMRAAEREILIQMGIRQIRRFGADQAGYDSAAEGAEEFL